jgi:hypothetical protein
VRLGGGGGGLYAIGQNHRSAIERFTMSLTLLLI